MIPTWVKPAALATGVAAVAAITYFSAPYVRDIVSGGSSTSSSADFTKTAYDKNGNVITGPVAVGDVIQYVLRYKPPANAAAGPITIDDTLSSNQSYEDDPSVQAPPGWNWSSDGNLATTGYTPYGLANHTTYGTSTLGPGNGFVFNIAAALGGTGTPNPHGDGALPIPVGGHIYGIAHHKQFHSSTQEYFGTNPQNSDVLCGYTGHPACSGGPLDGWNRNILADPPGAVIMCWDLYTLQDCAPASSGAWPLSLDLGAGKDERTTPTIVRTVVFGSRIYYPSASYDGANTTPGVGCWDTSADAPCAFLPLPMSWTGRYEGSANSASPIQNLNRNLAGVVGIPDAGNSNSGRIFMQAGDRVYCVPVGSGSCGWVQSPALGAANTNSDLRDVLMDEGSAPKSLYVHFSVSGSTTARVACIDVASGNLCSTWTTNPVVATRGTGLETAGGYSLSPYLDTSGAMVGICVHRNVGRANCVHTADGSVYATPNVVDYSALTPFHIPGTTQILYPAGRSFDIACYDFASGTPVVCSGFHAAWLSQPFGRGTYSDYGYAVDPLAPETCLLGLGHQGMPWRFKRDGSTGDQACKPSAYQTTFDLDSQFCFKKPTQATWTTVEILNRPSNLGGTIEFVDSTGAVLQTIPVGSANSYAVNIDAIAHRTITVKYTADSGQPLTADFQIRLNYTANEDSQICYKARVQTCGDDVSNDAALHLPAGDLTASVNLGKATGPDCPAERPCLELQTNITASADGTGTLVVSGSGPGAFRARTVVVHSLTPGVAIVPPATQHFANGQISGTWNLAGLTPGQVVKVRVDAFDRNGGATPGTDLCCSTVVTITVPRVSDRIDVAIAKTMGNVVLGPAGSTVSFKLAVSNVGAAVTTAGAIVVTDTVPAGMTFVGASGTDWNCGSSFPLSSGAPLTCTYTGPIPVAPGALLPPITVNALTGNPKVSVVNCASVSLAQESGLADSVAANNRACTGGGASGDEPDLTIVKACDPCPTGQACHCQVTVTSTGPVSHPVTFSDATIATWSAIPSWITNYPSNVTVTSANPWACTKSAANSPSWTGTTACTISAADFNAAGNSSEIDFVTNIQPGSDPGDAWESVNCVAVPPGVINKNDPPDNHHMCVHFGLNLGVNKVGPASCTAGGPCTFQIEVVNNHSTASFNGDIDLGDATPGLTVLSISPACAPTPTVTPFSCKAHVNLGPSQTATYTLTVQAPTGAQSFQNCAQITNTATEAFDIGYGSGVLGRSCTTVPLTSGPAAMLCPPGQGRVEGTCKPLCTGAAHWNGRACVTCEDTQAWNPDRKRCEPKVVKLHCDPKTTRLAGSECQCRYDGMMQRSATACACPQGSTLLLGRGCVRSHSVCDPRTQRLEGNACVCRYDGMVPGPIPLGGGACTCPSGTTLQDGKGCVRLQPSCPEHATYDPKKGRCVCPKDMKMLDGACRPKEHRSTLDDIIDNVHVDVGVQPGPGRDQPRRDKPPRESQPQHDGPAPRQ